MKTTTIIILILIVWQIVSAVLQSREEKKRKEKLRERSQQRRAGESTGSASQGAPAATTASAGSQSPREQLAARRKAQLEELRSRRAERSQGQVGGADDSNVRRSLQADLGTFTAPGSTAQSPEIVPFNANPFEQQTQSGERAGSQQRQMRRQQTAQRRQTTGAQQRGQQITQRAQQQAQQPDVSTTPYARRRTTQQQAVEQSAAAPVRAKRLGRAGRPITETAVGTGLPRDAYRIGQEENPRLTKVREQLMNPATLREIFLMKEILERPVGVRSNIDPYEPL